ncbi:MAG: FliM/FliN family flagellar motor switch protein [Vibrio sp.]
MSDLDILETEMDELDLLDDELDADLNDQLNEKANTSIQEPVEINSNMDLIKDIPVEITVEVSRKSLPLREILAFESGSTILLDKNEGEPVDIKINGVLFGTGSIVAQDGKYGVRILSMAQNEND